jgi:hypothetical protein
MEGPDFLRLDSAMVVLASLGGQVAGEAIVSVQRRIYRARLLPPWPPLYLCNGNLKLQQ